MLKRISSHIKLLEVLENLGISKPFRECYRHSFQGEIRYQLTKFFSDDTYVIKDIAGSQMRLDFSRKGLEKDLFIHGIREKESTEILKKELEEGMTVFDIGANIGYYMLIQAEQVGDSGHVLAVEPVPENFDRLVKNTELNQHSNVKCMNKAAGSRSKKVGIKRVDAPNRNRIVETGEDESNTEVETIDSLAEGKEPDLVRMDVEGYELEILKGMEKVLEKESLKLFLEIHPTKIEEFYGDELEDLWKILSKKDFRIKYLVRHPPQAKLSYFFKKQHAPRNVLTPNMPVKETLEEIPEFFNWKSTFRVFLEKD